MPDRILSIDVGTSSTKGLLVDAGGVVLASHSVGYPMHAPRPAYAEQDPEVILSAVRDVMAAVAPEDVDIVLGSAMHGVLCLDEQGAPLGNLITWADLRSAEVASELRASPAAAGLHERTGTPIHPMSPLCKIRHLAQHDPALFAATDRFVSIKEFVVEQLTGERCVDHSVASCTGLFDVHEFAWDSEALELAGITAARLSPLVPTRHVIDDATHHRRIVVGATDGVLANLGVGAVGPRTPCVTLGTSGAARLIVPRPQTDPSGRLFCYVLDASRWVIGGAINNGGLVLRWLRDTLTDGTLADDEIVEIAARAPAGANGLLCIPSIAGERYPSYRTEGFTTFVGLTPTHQREHQFRAGLEGMMLAFAPLLRELEGDGEPFAEIRIGGGMFAWPFCRQLLADVVDRTVAMPESRESSALGGARLGLDALGTPADWVFDTPSVHLPDPANHAIYAELSERRDYVLAALG